MYWGHASLPSAYLGVWVKDLTKSSWYFTLSSYSWLNEFTYSPGCVSQSGLFPCPLVQTNRCFIVQINTCCSSCTSVQLWPSWLKAWPLQKHVDFGTGGMTAIKKQGYFLTAFLTVSSSKTKTVQFAVDLTATNPFLLVPSWWYPHPLYLLSNTSHFLSFFPFLTSSNFCTP